MSLYWFGFWSGWWCGVAEDPIFLFVGQTPPGDWIWCRSFVFQGAISFRERTVFLSMWCHVTWNVRVHVSSKCHRIIQFFVSIKPFPIFHIYLFIVATSRRPHASLNIVVKSLRWPSDTLILKTKSSSSTRISTFSAAHVILSDFVPKLTWILGPFHSD
jgi:hypothetical protein